MKNNKVFSPLYLLLFIENYLFFSSHNSLNMLPPYLASLGANKGFIGLFMNINPLVMLIFIVLFSRIINNLPKRRALFSAFLIQIVSLVLMFIFADNLYILLPLRFAAAISFVFGFTIHANLAFEILPKAKLTSGIAIFGISGILSNPTGAILGETVLQHLHPKFLFILSAVFALTALCIVLLWHDPKGAERKRDIHTFAGILSRKNLYPLMFITIVYGGIFSVFSTFIPNFSKERLGFANLSIYFTSFGLIAVLSRLFFSSIMDTLQKNKLMTGALICMLTAMVMILFLHHPILLAFIGLIYGLGHSVMFPTMSTAFIENGSDEEKAILNNSYNAFNTFGNVFLTALLGSIGDFFGTESIFIVMAFLILVCIFFGVSYHSPKSGRKPSKNAIFSQSVD